MTAPTAPRSLDVDKLSLSLVPRSFHEFLKYVRVKSDDPAQPGITYLKDFPFQREVSSLLASGTSFIWLKERQLGATKAVLAPYCLWLVMFNPATTVGVVSAKETAVKSFMENVSLVYENLPQQIKNMAFNADIGVLHASFGPRAERSSLKAYTSAPNSGVGETFRLFVMDEASEHEYARENWETVIPAVGSAQIVLASTSNPRKGPSGFFYEKWKESRQGKGGLTPIFTGRHSRPDRTPEYYDQKLDELGPRVFAAYYPRTPEEAFQSQEGLVYQDDFDPQRNVTPVPERPFHLCEHTFAAYDLGGGDPTAMGVFGVWKDKKRGGWHIHRYTEFHKQTGLVSVDDLATQLAQWERSLKRRVDHIVPDHADLNFAHTWRKVDKRVWYPESKTRMRWLREKGKGLSTVAGFLREGRFTMSAELDQTIDEFSSYYWAENIDKHSRDHYSTSTPIDHHGDHHDVNRYAIMAAYYHLMRQRSVVTGFRGWH